MTPKSMCIITIQGTLIDKRLSYCTKSIKYENYAQRPFVGKFTRDTEDLETWLEAAESQLCGLCIVALVFNRKVKGRQGFSKEISTWKI